MCAKVLLSMHKYLKSGHITTNNDDNKCKNVYTTQGIEFKKFQIGKRNQRRNSHPSDLFLYRREGLHF